MKINRIYAIVLRNLYNFRHNFDRLSDAFYWPTIDLLLWGLTSIYFRSHITGAVINVVLMVVSGILFWIIIWRAQYEITLSLLSDLWDKNLINIFVSPLKFSEWITSFIILGIIKAMMSFIFAAGIAFLLYQVKIFNLGFYIIPFVLLLLMSGWCVGFFIAGLILRYGTRIQTLAWATVMIFSPFSAIYYPLSVLPAWAQQISAFVPMSYVFEGIREVIVTGTVDPKKIFMSFMLNVFYLVIALLFLRRSFKKTLEIGLIKSL